MQIALTKKLADALGLKPPAADTTVNPLFSWTANRTAIWGDRTREDALVLVNSATRFAVGAYQVKKKDLKNVTEIMKTAIANTLIHSNVNPAVVSEYMKLAGEVRFVKNTDRQHASWVSKAGLELAFDIGWEYEREEKVFDDTIACCVNRRLFSDAVDPSDKSIPFEKMADALTGLTGKQAHKYRAFELQVTLDLEVYKAKRRLIVPAHLKFSRLHRVLQLVYGWHGYHLHEFAVFAKGKRAPVITLVSFEDCLEYDDKAVLVAQHTLSEVFPQYKRMIYTYDMGDDWRHEIRLIRVIEDYDRESPYLLKAVGQTPPEDVGGVGGYMEFLKAILNPDHPEHKVMKDWAGYWTPELQEWQKEPRAIHV